MITNIWSVTAEFESIDDAMALKELIAELGYTSKVTSRQVDDLNLNRRPSRDTRLGKLVLSQFTPGRTFCVNDMETVCLQHDYKKNSAPAILALLAREGDLVRVDRGLYRLADGAGGNGK